MINDESGCNIAARHAGNGKSTAEQPHFASEADRLAELISVMWEEDPENVEICRHLRTLGSYKVLDGSYSEASFIFKRLRSLLARHSGPYDLSVVETLDWIGVMEILQDQIERAGETFLNALAILSECGFPALPMRAKLLLHLGHVLIEQKDFALAEVKLKQATSFQLCWLKTGLAQSTDRALMCDIMVTLRRLFHLTNRQHEVKEIDRILAASNSIDLPAAS